MTKAEHIEFWKISAHKDRTVAENLFSKANYPQCLFFGHLVLEKLLKAHWVKDNTDDFPPRTHNLVRLASHTQLVFPPSDLLLLDKLNDFQMEGRYPDYNFSIYQLCTQTYTESLLLEIQRIEQWLLNQLP